MKKQKLFTAIMLTLSTLTYAQETKIQLPTTDSTSSFTVIDSSNNASSKMFKFFADGGFYMQGTYDQGDIPIEGAGTRLMWYPNKAAFRVGRVLGDEWNDDNIGKFSTAMGESTTASGYISTAMGVGTTASGYYSTAMGVNTTASGYISTAMGGGTIASGEGSTAMGYADTASGYYSTAMGYNTIASSSYSTAIGIFNVGGGDSIEWIPEDPLFEIGIGTPPFNRANAVTVLKNGNFGIGTTTPSYLLEVNGTAGKPGGGSWSNSSDIRLKNINSNYTKGLKEIIRLKPICFNYKKGNPRELPSNTYEIGFIAQEVQDIFPEAVIEGADGYLDFNMHAINVAMVSAVRELNEKNGELNSQIEEMKAVVAELKALVNSFTDKFTKLDADNNIVKK